MGAEQPAIAQSKNASASHHGPSRLAPSDRRNEAFDFCRDQPGQLNLMIAIAVATGNRVLIGRTLVTIREGRQYGWVAVLRFATYACNPPGVSRG
jgi:hypothetical protein